MQVIIYKRLMSLIWPIFTMSASTIRFPEMTQRQGQALRHESQSKPNYLYLVLVDNLTVSYRIATNARKVPSVLTQQC